MTRRTLYECQSLSRYAYGNTQDPFRPPSAPPPPPPPPPPAAMPPKIDAFVATLGVAMDEDADPEERGIFGGRDPRVADAGLGGVSALLHYAVANGDLEEAYRLIVEEDANPNALNPNRSTPCHVAAHLGLYAMCEMLLEQGANLALCESHNVGGYTPLHHAVRGNHLQIVELLLSQGSDPNAQETGNGFTCLHFCARQKGLQDMAKLLMAKGADVSQCDNDNCSPSYWAKETGNAAFLAIRGVPEPEAPSLDDLLAGLQERDALRNAILNPPKSGGGGGKKKKGKKKK